jgi:hypothetical protein
VSPDMDVAQHLAAAGLGLTLGGNLYASPSLPSADASVPVRAVFVLSAGGDVDAYLGGGSLWEAPVEVTVRSPSSAYAAGRTLALACLEALHLAQLPGYVSCAAEAAQPEYLGQDESGAHEWVVDVLVWWTS